VLYVTAERADALRAIGAMNVIIVIPLIVAIDVIIVMIVIVVTGARGMIADLGCLMRITETVYPLLFFMGARFFD
jgi:hypothetical protein